MNAVAKPSIALLIAAHCSFAAACGPRATHTSAATWAQPNVSSETAFGLRASVAPYTAAQERDAFGVDLHENAVIAVALKLVRADSATGTLIVRRHGIQARFADGATRYALDPRKVYERHRISPVPGALAFGILGGVLAVDEDAKRNQVFSGSAFESVTLAAPAEEISGFLFFDISGIARQELSSIEIEIENPSAGEVNTLRMRVAGEPAPATTESGSP
jgi:hypothetical protein